MEVGAATTAAADSTAANLLIFVPRADDPLAGGPAHAIDALLDGALSLLVAAGELTGKRGQVTVVHTLGRAPMTRVLVAGLGDPGAIDLERVRNATATAARRARALADGTLDVAIAGPPLDALDETDLAQAITEGLLLGLYRFDRHLHPKEAPKSISGARILGHDAAALAEGVRRGAILGEATNFCRDLANEPSNLLTPTEMAARAETMARDTGLEIQVLEESDAAELGMGSFLGVAKGSHQPAKMIILRHRGGGDEPGLALIGKGITFDTGGISLKPSASMVSMKQDMSGGAAVIAAIGALARLNAPANVTAIVPATENMPGGSAIKPSDVLTAMNGKTIEVLNTDAEGRLVLADALCYANHLGLTPLIDVATLTGAVAVALGTTTTGLMTNDDALGAEVIAAGAVSGEKIWQLPMFDDYDDLIKSPIADVKNTGGRYAGAITAAKFLEVFAGDTPWVHLDMAGTDDADKDSGATVRGATGVPVRTLVRWVLDRAAKQKESS
ncbi:MAG: leucyl aminopeptidase [Chloroflexi bacterium]|nr:MAG: leucyl aminopeptidase [Chloroflexota bacterium]